MNRAHAYHWLAALALFCSLPGFAATVYKTIDSNGVVTYSDVKPRGEVVVETFEFEQTEPADSADAAQRLQEMREITDRMAADRMAREQHRAQMRQLEAQAAEREEPEEIYYEPVPIYRGGYSPYTYPARRPPWRPPFPPRPPRPDHPIVQPPLTPPRSSLPPGVRPLPGNEYPASLIRRGYDPKVREALR